MRDGIERKFPYCDYMYKPLSPWNYAFSKEDFKVHEYPVAEDFVFSEEKPPVTLTAELVPIQWGHAEDYENLCAAVLRSRKALGKPETHIPIPYGCTTLRMTEMPFAEGETES